MDIDLRRLRWGGAGVGVQDGEWRFVAYKGCSDDKRPDSVLLSMPLSGPTGGRGGGGASAESQLGASWHGLVEAHYSSLHLHGTFLFSRILAELLSPSPWFPHHTQLISKRKDHNNDNELSEFLKDYAVN